MIRDRGTKILLLPLMILLSIIPLIVRYTQILLTDSQAIEMWGSMPIGDLFSQVKAGCILIITGVLCIILFFIYSKKYCKVDIYMKSIYITIGIYSIATLISTFISQYKNTALWGVVDRAEGGVMLISYVLIMLYSIYVIRKIDSYRYIVGSLLVLTMCLTVLGYYQYIGQDLLTTTDWGKALIIPEKYKEYRDSIRLLYEEKRIYGTLFHYNYVGSFAAMVIPLFVTLAIWGKGKAWRILCLIGTGCSIFLLLGSTSRAGLIGVGLSVIVGSVFLGKRIIKGWKSSIIVVCVMIVGLVSINQITQGAIFERIPSLVEDIKVVFGLQQGESDLVNKLPIEDIITKDKNLMIDTGEHVLIISAEEEELKFTDELGKEIIYDETEGIYQTQDTRFSSIAFQNVERAVKNKEVWEILAPDTVFTFVSSQQDGVYLVDNSSLEAIQLQHVEAIGFEGKEQLGSARGYIWSRTLPLLKDTWLIGNGPDTFIYEFPQQDYLGKWKAYGTTNMIVDKAHNLYLQIAINQGGVALISFILMIGIYLIQSSKLYAFKANVEERHIVGVAFMLAVIGYLGAGIFNDSVVSVAPIFWIILGVGIAVNFINSQLNRKQEQRMPHATIDMKKRTYIANN